MSEQKAHFGFTKLVVQDLERAAEFYKDVAGLTELARVSDAIAGRAIDEILFNATGEGAATFVLLKFLDRTEASSDEVVIGFQTLDILRFVERVKAAGGTVVEEPVSAPQHGVKVAFVTDPEGHLIEVVELLHQS